MSDGGEQAAGDAEGQTAPEEKSSARVCAETSLDALAVVGRGIMTTGSALLTAVQYTAYPIKEGAICVMDTTSEYFSPYLKKLHPLEFWHPSWLANRSDPVSCRQAANHVPTFRYG
ncbi:unnamed protein product [Symbiodinium necroappetens]|uniref:Uncharacterized protein n=1 Tax=Symbiodinium necroappetens TaxID=1628268 RepID=A0A812WJY0_9DINO|nr:unnamed protein product [Symbiodinium necroappetens]